MSVITKLRLKNFKSFKKVEMPLTNGFTVIAGANGSGKSNIIDSILFGLGITSMKMLRASKLSDLINNNANDNQAQVDITLKKNNEEYQITRSIDKQGKSVCRINGKRCTLNEISTLLEELNIKVDGHNIVVQGDVTKIINLNAIQRREIIDEIAGLKEFEEKKQEALKELEKVDSKIKSTRIVLNERQIALDKLEKERQDALKHKELQTELKRAQATLIKSQMDLLQTQLNELNEEQNKFQTQLNELNLQKENNIRKLTQLERRFEEINNQLIKTSQKTFDVLGREIEEKKGQIRLYNERIQNNQNLIAKNKNKIQQLQEKNQLVLEQIGKSSTEVSKLQKEIQEIEKQIKEEQKKIQIQKSDLKEKRLEKIALEEKLNELNKQIQVLNDKSVELKTKNTEIEVHKKFREDKLKELYSQKTELEKKVNEKKAIQKEIQELNAKGKPEDLLTELREQINNTMKSIGERETELYALNEDKKKLEGNNKCPLCETYLNEQKILTILNAKKEKHLNLHNKLTNLKQKLELLKEENKKMQVLQEKIIEKEKQIANLEEIFQKLEETTKQITKLEENKRETREKIEKQLSELETQLTEKTNSKNSLLTEIQKFELNDFENKIQEMQETLDKQRSVLFEKKNYLNELTSTTRQSDSIIKENNEEILFLKKEIKAFEEQITKEEKLSSKSKSHLKELELQMKKVTEKNKELLDEKIKVNKKIFELRKKLENKTKQSYILSEKINELNVKKSGNEIKLIDLEEEYKEHIGIKLLENNNIDYLKKRILEIESNLEKLGEVNLKSISSYNEFQEELNEISKKAEKLDEERLAVLNLIDKIDVKRNNIFIECFEEINSNFNKIYSRLSKGEGKLSLTNPEKPLESGLIIQAKHSGEKLKKMELMSGGEKSLTALAFMFAIQMYNPAPFYIFDEADAALDKTNSQKLAQMIKEIATISQFIVVTHNDAIVEAADQIIGVTLNSSKSSVIGLNVKKQAKQSSKEEHFLTQKPNKPKIESALIQ